MIYGPRIFQQLDSASWNLRGTIASPGQTGSGILPAVSIDGGGLWTAELNLVLCTKDDVRCARAIRAIAAGGAIAMAIPREDRYQPWPLVDGVPLTTYGDIPFDDGALFSDGVGFFQPVIQAVTVETAALRATSIVIDIQYGESPRGGECFSLFHAAMKDRHYEIINVEQNDDGDWVCQIRPPLREATTAGMECNFDLPYQVMRLSKIDGMDETLPLTPLPVRVTGSFIEAFEPLE